MTDGEAMLAGITDHPGDDALRLVYADWCDDSGQPERAEFIRVQMRIAQLEAKGEPLRCANCGTFPAWHSYSPRCRGGMCRLRQREYYSGRRHCGWDWRQGVPQAFVAQYRRGFPWGVIGSQQSWISHGAAACGSQPLGRVRLTDLRISMRDYGGGDERPALWASQFSGGIWEQAVKDGSTFAEFSSVKEAEDAVSVLCLNWARARLHPAPASR